MEIGAASQMLVTGDRLHLQCRLYSYIESASSFFFTGLLSTMVNN